MKPKYIHLVLASLVLASCGGTSSSSSSVASSQASAQSSSDASIVSSETPSSSESTPTSSAITPAHDKAKTVENILAAKTYRLDNFTHIEVETDAGGSSGAKSTGIIEGHNYFEIHEHDFVFWNEVSTATQMKLSDYLAQSHMTLEQLKQILPMMEESGMKVTIDEENDLLIMNMGSFSPDESKTYAFYNADIKQYEQYVYTVNEEEGEICGESSYVLDGDALIDVPTAINELALYTLDKGTFNPEECSYTVTNFDKAELPSYFQESIAPLAKGITLTIKDNYPNQLLLDVDIEALASMVGAPEGATILVTTYGIDFDYKGPFSDLTGKRIGVHCEYQHHGYTQYEYYENGYRPYCSDCNMYLSEKQPYSYDSTYHVCTKSGHIDGMEHGAKETYEGLIYADQEAGIEYYAFGYQYNEKYGTKWNTDVFEVKRIDPYSDYEMEIYSTYDDGTIYRYWVEQKALVVETSIGRYPLSEGCRVVCKQNHSFYKNVDLNVDLIQSEDEWKLLNGQPLSEALKGMMPEESIESFFLTEEHEHTHETTYKGDDCNTLHVEVCDDCGETVGTYLYPTNHAFEYGEVITYDALVAFLEASDAYNRWKEEEVTLVVKATCTKCDSIIVFVITSEYATDGSYWIGSFDGWGDFGFTLTDDPLPDLNDAAGKPIFPIQA